MGSWTWYNYNKTKFTTAVKYTADNMPGIYYVSLNAGHELGSTQAYYNFTVEVVDNKYFKIYYSTTYDGTETYDVLEQLSGNNITPTVQLKTIFAQADNTELQILGTRNVNIGTDLPQEINDNHDLPPYILINYYGRHFSKQDQSLEPYSELVSIAYIESFSGGISSKIGATFTLNVGTHEYISFVSKYTALDYFSNDNIKKQKLSVVLIAHELGHQRFMYLSNDNEHTKHHNGNNNKPCIMSAIERFDAGDQWHSSLFLFTKQIEVMSFCEGHKQRLSTINWSY